MNGNLTGMHQVPSHTHISSFRLTQYPPNTWAAAAVCSWCNAPWGGSTA